jgi:hypothetical protein
VSEPKVAETKASASYEPYLIEVDPADDDFEDYTVKTATAYEDGLGWSISTTDSTGFGLPRLTDDQPAPEPGDTIRTYGSFGRPMRGAVHNGRVVWYRTKELGEASHRRWVEDYHAQRKRRFARSLPALDAQYEALSAPMKARIARFRAKDPDFRWESEDYEAFICQQADLLVEHFGDEGAILAWNSINSDQHAPKYDYQEQMRQAPPGWGDGHSGNTHGTAVALACAMLRGEPV